MSPLTAAIYECTFKEFDDSLVALNQDEELQIFRVFADIFFLFTPQTALII